MTKILSAVLFCLSFSLFFIQTPSSSHPPLSRQYRDGEILRYHMKGLNENWHYEIQVEGVVKKDSSGRFFEEYQWSDLVSNGQKTALAPSTADFRQRVSLDPNDIPSIPDLSHVDLKLIGPITDFMTIYSDLWLAGKIGSLTYTGDHFYFKRGGANSWADGNYVTLGEDSIDFDFTLANVNPADKTATLIVRHVPPAEPGIHIPADWMRAPVSDSANNWIEVRKDQNGKYTAAVGKETFDVQIKVSLENGKILSANIENPVRATERQCEDAALEKCGDPKPHSIERQIQLSIEE
ncbi:MAG TPA: hypothetical protein VJR23_11615 [Candidatus Acidoferrales bacterium]|nr:hypothetical protein [Candidatus Acidoferrales bacterium]